jgi:hypothetical protein
MNFHPNTQVCSRSVLGASRENRQTTSPTGMALLDSVADDADGRNVTPEMQRPPKDGPQATSTVLPADSPAPESPAASRLRERRKSIDKAIQRQGLEAAAAAEVRGRVSR